MTDTLCRSGIIKMKYNIELTKNQLIAALAAFQLFSEDYKDHWTGVNPNFKKGVDQTVKKMEKEYNKHLPIVLCINGRKVS